MTDRTVAVRFDALTQIAERVVADRPAATERGDVGRLALVIDAEGVAEMAALNDAGEVETGQVETGQVEAGELTLGGRRIAPEVAKRWSCDIRASVMLEHQGHACDEGRDTRIVNRTLRRALHRRDGGMCRFPGCGVTSWLHAHHIVHWADNGRTDLDNLVSLCGYHHQLVHEGGWTVAIADGAVVWSDADGLPATVEPQKTSARLEVHFVGSVLAEHITRQRRRLRGDVSVAKPTIRARERANRAWVPQG